MIITECWRVIFPLQAFCLNKRKVIESADDPISDNINWSTWDLLILSCACLLNKVWISNAKALCRFFQISSWGSHEIKCSYISISDNLHVMHPISSYKSGRHSLSKWLNGRALWNILNKNAQSTFFLTRLQQKPIKFLNRDQEDIQLYC